MVAIEADIANLKEQKAISESKLHGDIKELKSKGDDPPQVANALDDKQDERVSSLEEWRKAFEDKEK